MTIPDSPIASSKCPYCSADLDPSSAVCPACGRWLEVEKKPEYSKTDLRVIKTNRNSDNTRYNRQTLIILLGAVGVIVLALCALGAGFIWWNNQQKAEALAKNPTQTAIAGIRTATAQFIATQEIIATRNALGTQEASLTQAATATLQALETQEALAAQEAQALEELRNGVSNWSVVVSDTFETDSSNWYVGETEDEWVRGTWSIENGQYQITLEAIDGFSQWMWPGEVGDVDDFYLAADLDLVEGPDSMDGGLIFRLQQDDQYYLFDLMGDGNYAVFRHSANGWETIVDITPAENYQRNEPNFLEVVGQGNTYTLFLNQEKLIAFQDDQLSQGWVGFQVGLTEAGTSGTWAFDNFDLRSP